MTLLDAPKFDEARDRRRRMFLSAGAGAILVLFVAFWLASGRPIDWPWNWYIHLAGRSTMNRFLADVEQDNLQKAYGVWVHDPNWQQHHNELKFYTFATFQKGWGPDSSNNDYGTIKSHKIVAARVYGNALLAAILINGRKSGALSLEYDPRTHTLLFPPPDVEIDPESYSH
ncbi:MAG TPA: hypothetical protein VME23_02270 [Terracidiphilus sp.]|nr:hypothetical protein [Terracidiphilus sp.]